MKYNKKIFTFCISVFTLFNLTTAKAHIELMTPESLQSAKGGGALKVAPFGAPDIDIKAAKATSVKSGSYIEIEIEGYIVHPGYITVSYTTDMTGQDLMPVLSIPASHAAIPQKNLLAQFPSPCPENDCKPRRAKNNFVKRLVKLPEIEGEIILVIRQIMTDKLDPQKDGSVSLKRIYYHQSAKLKLVK